jgi:hypothetical protein
MDYRDNPPPAAQVVPHCTPIPVPNSKPIDNPDHDRLTLGRQILKVAAVAAVRYTRGLLAIRAGASGGCLT